MGRARVLEDVSLEVSRGHHVGVTGPSGSGKSTLAAVLVRFLDPSAGAVRMDGCDLRTLDADDVRRAVGLVDDDPYVFSSTVFENLRLAAPAAGRADVDRVLRAVRLGEWLDGLPDGLDTFVGDGHSAVSGGERARLGLARALLADKPFLVLDEPTAHLDTATAREVAEDLLAACQDRALVWITHDGVGLDRMHDRGGPRPQPGAVAHLSLGAGPSAGSRMMGPWLPRWRRSPGRCAPSGWCCAGPWPRTWTRPGGSGGSTR